MTMASTRIGPCWIGVSRDYGWFTPCVHWYCIRKRGFGMQLRVANIVAWVEFR